MADAQSPGQPRPAPRRRASLLNDSGELRTEVDHESQPATEAALTEGSVKKDRQLTRRRTARLFKGQTLQQPSARKRDDPKDEMLAVHKLGLKMKTPLEMISDSGDSGLEKSFSSSRAGNRGDGREDRRNSSSAPTAVSYTHLTLPTKA